MPPIPIPPHPDPHGLAQRIPHRRLWIVGTSLLLIGCTWHVIDDAWEWDLRSQQTARIEQHYPDLAGQLTELHACMGSWGVLTQARRRWLACDLVQVRKADRAGLGIRYVHFMLERDRQLDADHIRLYPNQSIGGGSD